MNAARVAMKRAVARGRVIDWDVIAPALHRKGAEMTHAEMNDDQRFVLRTALVRNESGAIRFRSNGVERLVWPEEIRQDRRLAARVADWLREGEPTAKEPK